MSRTSHEDVSRTGHDDMSRMSHDDVSRPGNGDLSKTSHDDVSRPSHNDASRLGMMMRAGRVVLAGTDAARSLSLQALPEGAGAAGGGAGRAGAAPRPDTGLLAHAELGAAAPGRPRRRRALGLVPGLRPRVGTRTATLQPRHRRVFGVTARAGWEVGAAGGRAGRAAALLSSPRGLSHWGLPGAGRGLAMSWWNNEPVTTGAVAEKAQRAERCRERKLWFAKGTSSSLTGLCADNPLAVLWGYVLSSHP